MIGLFGFLLDDIRVFVVWVFYCWCFVVEVICFFDVVLISCVGGGEVGV